MNSQHPQERSQHSAYVLMTAAYNEEATIEKAIESELSQTLLPQRWDIVSDGSVDRTDEIVHKYRRINFPGRCLRNRTYAGGSHQKCFHRSSQLIGNLS